MFFFFFFLTPLNGRNNNNKHEKYSSADNAFRSTSHYHYGPKCTRPLYNNYTHNNNCHSNAGFRRDYRRHLYNKQSLLTAVWCVEIKKIKKKKTTDKSPSRFRVCSLWFYLHGNRFFFRHGTKSISQHNYASARLRRIFYRYYRSIIFRIIYFWKCLFFIFFSCHSIQYVSDRFDPYSVEHFSDVTYDNVIPTILYVLFFFFFRDRSARG